MQVCTYNHNIRLQELGSINKTYFKSQITGGLNTPFMSFVHVIMGGTIAKSGEVWVLDYKIAPPMCQENVGRMPPRFNEKNVYDEVFVISQNWANGPFHIMIENMPRLAPFLPFLRRHAHIRIHVFDRRSPIDDLVRALRLDPLE